MGNLAHRVVRVVTLLMLATTALVHAQTGTIRGRAVNARSLAPLTAQVSIPALSIGAMADGSGVFVIQNVPVGTHELRVDMLGYRTVTREVVVREGEVVEVNFELAEQALALDEIVVTGTAGGSQRRAVGNVVDRISADEIREVSPATDVSQLIGQRS